MFYIYLYVTKICTNSGKPINVYDFSSPLQSELGRRSQQGRDLDKSGDPNKYRNCVCRDVRDEFFRKLSQFCPLCFDLECSEFRTVFLMLLIEDLVFQKIVF